MDHSTKEFREGEDSVVFVERPNDMCAYRDGAGCPSNRCHQGGLTGQ